MSDPLSQHCPSCGDDVDFEPWGDPFPCPHCGAQLQHEHDCYYDEESGDEYCSDWLEVVR